MSRDFKFISLGFIGFDRMSVYIGAKYIGHFTATHLTIDGETQTKKGEGKFALMNGGEVVFTSWGTYEVILCQTLDEYEKLTKKTIEENFR